MNARNDKTLTMDVFRESLPSRIFSQLVLGVFLWSQMFGTLVSTAEAGSRLPKPSLIPVTQNEAVERTLGEILVRLASEAQAKASKDAKAAKPGVKAKLTLQQRKALLLQVRAQVAAQSTQQHKAFAETAAHLAAAKLPDSIQKRQAATAAQYDAAVAQSLAAFDSAGSAKTDAEFATRAGKALKQLEASMQQGRAVRPATRAFRVPSSKVRAPRLTRQQLAGLYGADPMMVADAGGASLLMMMAAAGLPVPVDTQPTDDAQITPAITARAAQLHNNPVEIYTWVRNNITWQPVYGSIQGSAHTLQAGQGNAYDIASLLIALLRAAGVAARYAYGTVEVPVADLQNQLGGLKQPEAVLSLLAQGGIPSRSVLVAGQIQSVQMEHVWAEAYVDYYPTRGAKNLVPDAWAPMDASFKTLDLKPGFDLPGSVHTDSYGLMNQLEHTSTIDNAKGRITGLNNNAIQSAIGQYQGQVQTALSALGPDATVATVLGSRGIKQESIDALPAALPYKVITQLDSSAALSEGLQHRYHLSLYASAAAQAAGTAVLSHSLSLPALAGRKLTLSFAPSTPDDQATLDSYYASSLPSQLPGYLIHLRAELRLDGEVIASGGEFALGTPLVLSTGLSDPRDTQGGARQWSDTTDTVYAGEYQGIAVDGAGISPAELSAAGDRLAAVTAQYAANQAASLGRDQVSGEVLHTTALGYFAIADSYTRHYQRAANVSSVRLPSAARAAAELEPQIEFGVPVAVSFPGVALRVDRLSASAAAIADDTASLAAKAADYQRQTLERGSAYAHLTLENLYSAAMQGAPGASAIKALATSLSDGGALYAIDSSNAALSLPLVNVPADTRAALEDGIHAGLLAVVSENPVSIAAWQGSGAILADKETGEGSYTLTGGATGLIEGANGLPCLALASAAQAQACIAPVLASAQNLSKAQAATLGDTDGLKWSELAANGEIAGGLFTGTLGGSGVLAWAAEVQATRYGSADAGSLAQANRPPVWMTSANAAGQEGKAYHYSASAADPDGNPITYSIAQAPGGLAISETGHVSWPQPIAGQWPVSLAVSDGKSTTLQNYTLKVKAPTSPIVISLAVTPAIVNASQTVGYQVTATGGYGALAKTLSVNGTPVVLNANGQASFSAPATPGVYAVVATVTDEDNATQTKAATLSVKTPADTTAPQVSILSPAADTEIRAPITVSGSVSDNTILAYYELKIRPTGSGTADWVTVGRGESAVSNGLLGKLDPTTYANGIYDLGLFGTDANGNIGSQVVTVEFTRDLKIGQFSLSFEDLSVEAAGIPIRVTRTYDTRIKGQKKDFGYGWTVDAQSLNIRANMPMGINWAFTREPLANCWRPGAAHKVSITLPDGHVERFVARQTPECALPFPQVNISFDPLPGTLSTLKLINIPPNIRFQADVIYDLDAGGPWEPTDYVLTTEDRTEYTLKAGVGIKQVKDPFGNTLTYTTNGMIHSDGRSIPFTRDAQGRITEITDPAGKKIKYTYNTAGDLVSVTDREGKTTTLAYNNEHGLTDYTDPRGIKVAKQIYDDQGRLIATVDAQGQRTEVTHDTDNSTEVVKDRNGNVTKYVYDAAGNVTSMTNALNQTTSYEYDALGNETKVTDPLGNVTTRVFDPQKGKMLSESVTVSPGHVLTTGYTYNTDGNPKTTTDPKGKVTTYGYSVSSGRPLSITEPLGRVIGMGYDGKGNLNSLNLAGDSSSYVYDLKGNRTSETDGSGATSTYAFDSNGHETGKTWTQTVDGVARTFSESNVYDTEGRLTESTNALGHKVKTGYNANGQPVTETDPVGRVTTTAYNERQQAAKLTYADGTSESTEYDAQGNVTIKTDRQGRATRTGYDQLNRPETVTMADGSTTSMTYDAAGRQKTSVDARGNVSTNNYDGAGRLTSTMDALNQIVRYGYDDNGNRTSVTDPKNKTTTFEYDDLNRLTKTIYPDSTFSTTSWSLQGRKTSETDQNGTTTRFGYDGNGRLTTVTQTLNGVDLITRYGYDEASNKISQTDASNRVTKWGYDALHRVTKRTLPLGQVERFEYDAAGNVQSHTDFNGQTTRYTYDSNNRRSSQIKPDGSKVIWTYTASGQVETETDTRGITRFSYDALDRLTKKDCPEGILTYAYDRNGNRTQLTSPAGTVKYTFDELNRLATVTDQGGKQTTYEYDENGNRKRVSLPNNVTTTYVYDDNNRLLRLTHQNTDSGNVLAQYRYTLRANGMREKLEEYNSTAAASGNLADRVVSYSYDDLYRLTQEKVEKRNAAVLEVTRTTGYGYDSTGNRLTKTEVVAGVTTNTGYTYDANDRLLTEAVGAEVSTYSYDENGSTTKKASAGAVTLYGYDSERRLNSLKAGATESAATLVSVFVYDASGSRISSTADGSTTRYLVDQNLFYAQVVEEASSGASTSKTLYVYGDDLLSQARSGQKSFYQYDGLGSVRVLTSADGNVTDRYDFEAFGAIEHQSGNTLNDYLFAGEQLDPNSGFYYLRARYMDPRVGRFISMDQFRGTENEPASLHKYLYGNANPGNVIDPSGRFGLMDVSIAHSLRSMLMNIQLSTGSALFDSLVDPERAVTNLALGAAVGVLVIAGGAALIRLFTRGKEIAGGVIRLTASKIISKIRGTGYRTQQVAVSIPKIERFVTDMVNGAKFPAVKVDGKVIVDGHHTFIAAKIANVEIEFQQATRPLHKVDMPDMDIAEIRLDEVDW